ncbi:hypothetical protein Pen01_08740 [Phytomonospora endophytica]|nr:hypothetical protein Pen01_08740 [Phytomonospora endophytica]
MKRQSSSRPLSAGKSATSKDRSNWDLVFGGTTSEAASAPCECGRANAFVVMLVSTPVEFVSSGKVFARAGQPTAPSI